MLTAIIYYNSKLWDLDVIEKPQPFRGNVNMSLDVFSLVLLFILISIHKIIEKIQKRR